jgi:hypothetical protein
MNIFVLDLSPRLAAQYHCDVHVPKMILESVQLICTAHHVLGTKKERIPYKATHINHPCAVWVRESVSNYYWLLELVRNLNMEYRWRFGKKANHRSHDALLRLPLGITLPFTEVKMSPQRMTPFPLCMPEAYRVEGDPVTSYRNYYKGGKAQIATWSRLRGKPDWY